MATNPRSAEHKAEIDRKWRSAVDAATATFQRITAQAVSNYEAEVSQAAGVLERALETGQQIRNSIMIPAQNAYDRQAALAATSVEAIVKPAQALFDRTLTEAQDAWNSVYPAALSAYQAELGAANQAKSAAQHSAG